MTAATRDIPWSTGTWTNEPAATRETPAGLAVTAIEGSDAWRTTAYGFVHDSEHALLAPFERGQALEVAFVADLTGEFDQAGLFVRAADDHWVKTGIELSDGVAQVGAVVTAPVSDWSMAPVPEWQGREVTMRASWAGDALTIRARVDGEPFRLVRVVPFDPDAAVAVSAGPLVSAPTRAGLTVRFVSWRLTAADESLH
ncbi:DUF1349 domain-containing protein [Herbiconiux daphne]|uniref:DUF1349 domain-containing protein n=1 Tax=Herbiconiux daphne TaxID=2970914 RepID=A0ABT2H335_9MICO|nr:DUF1349 domain-containing protein [Herbiconiux daphne]MCS5734349.1 DUF1349 domain-containing protein [Herbiconiux daphne]